MNIFLSINSYKIEEYKPSYLYNTRLILIPKKLNYNIQSKIEKSEIEKSEIEIVINYSTIFNKECIGEENDIFIKDIVKINTCNDTNKVECIYKNGSKKYLLKQFIKGYKYTTETKWNSIY